MSIRGKVMAAAVVMTLAGGVSAVGTLTAQAATPSCYEHCIDLFSQKFGTHASPSFVLDVQLAQGKAGQPIRLYRASNGDPGEDFFISKVRRVSVFADFGLVSSAVAVHYGGACASVNSVTNKCVSHYPNDWAYQIEYAPNGVPSGLCMSLAQTAGDGTMVVLEPCGSSTMTTWVVDANAALGNPSVPLINGSDTNVVDPYVLNYPGSAKPIQMPTPQLTTWSLQRYPNGHVFNNQLWSADFGPLTGLTGGY
jgi:hypothetical protein